MISANEFRNGVTVMFDHDICQIVDFQHVKPGKGAAFVRARLKNLKSGSTVDHTFRPSEKLQRAHVDRKDMQYLYTDGELYHFMDTANFEQLAIGKDFISDTLKYVKENELVKVLMHDEEVFGIEPPMFVELIVTATETGLKGDSATGALKPATLETGVIINVPLFINKDDVLKIDTRTGEYLGRA